MTVVTLFPRETSGGWQHAELQQLIGVFAAHRAAGAAEDWSTGETERADPQFYLLGQSPDQDCVLAISRVGGTYVLEDGAGGVLAEDRNLGRVASRAVSLARRSAIAHLYGRIVVGWYALREAFEEKLEPLLAEPVELLTHAVPQLAALA